MYNPITTYRIQFHKDFTFAHLEAAIPYLQKLGIQTLYASPIFEAVPGSTHGYDGITPHRINPEIGTEEDLRRISALLRESGIGWLQDIVPNHMAFHPGNAWLMDVLEKGQASEYASFFDIGWESGEKLMVPFLGAPLEEVIGRGELTVVEESGKQFFDYFGNRYPIASGKKEAQSSSSSKADIQQLANAQHYRFCHWQETDRRINYRRFFTVNGLICLNIQDEKVFAYYHQYVAQLYKEGVFTGLRIDHIDGLYNPQKYLEDLRALVGKDAYIVVEKILEPGEGLPKSWPIQGNTGYDFLSLANNLFTQRESQKPFTRFYESLTGDTEAIHQQLRDKKAHILYSHMRGELDNLTQLFRDLLPEGTSAPSSLKLAIGETLIQCPVYRYYGESMPLLKEDATALRDIFHRIRDSKPELREGLRLLQDALLKKPLEGDEDYNAKALLFYQRLMQFSGPLMAKGVEDTLMYTYNRFVGHNDVGDSPESFGISKEAFHKAMLERQQQWPLSLNATSTHDTKRGEDARAMLNVLTDVPEGWMHVVAHWRELNAALKQDGAPDAQDEYFIYQTLFATYPFEESLTADYGERLTEYLEKALREGKRKSDWGTPDETYEAAVKEFALQLLKPEHPFRKSFTSFREGLLNYGILNALSQTIIRFTAPGVPDTYQGTELWDLSIVDPDNRRPVDYAKRTEWLNAQHEDFLQADWEKRAGGRIKLSLTQALISLRASDPELFEKGLYIPLRTNGKFARNVFAFGRRYARRWVVIAVPLHLAALGKDIQDIHWGDTAIELPKNAPRQWTGVLGNEKAEHSETISVKTQFRNFPLAIIKGEKPENRRAAGVLMPVAALPSAYGIGDFGPEAKAFAKTLSRAGQTFWQLLPLNPISGGSGWSPYSSISTMAGNPMLISPDLLVEEGLLDEEEAEEYRHKSSNKVAYEKVAELKSAMLQKAYSRFSESKSAALKRFVEVYKESEEFWLTDFALYVIIKRAQNDKPWYDWPEAFRKRDADTLRQFSEENRAALEEVIWQQAIISHQWQSLRAWCAALGILLIGDLPFYASYDSADVWSRHEIFSVDGEGKMMGVAGVPPDYFSETGQLWGMPTFKWDILKADGYKWWIDRLRKNLQLYDVLRIDHFRALAAYWEVPAGEETAVNGQWIEGPETHFFDAIREAFSGLPFIAEDLGDNMEAVYQLRDDVQLPGMKVMQFAFGENIATAVDAPHNYGTNFIAYTGTHDNNTTLGWFRQEVKAGDRKRIELYTNARVTEKNVNEIMAKLVYGSVAKIAILPMQDVLQLGEDARMNTPGAGTGNWAWRMEAGAFGEAQQAWLREMARFYNRL